MNLLGSLCEMLLRRHLLQGLFVLHLHGGDSLVLHRSTALSRLFKKTSANYQAISNMCILWWNVWNQNYSTVFCPIPIMYCITYWVLWRTLVTICNNDLTLLLSRQKTATWSERIYCMHRMLFRDTYLAFIRVLLYLPHCFTVFVVNFYLTLYLYVCCSGLHLLNLIKETTYLLTLRNWLI